METLHLFGVGAVLIVIVGIIAYFAIRALSKNEDPCKDLVANLGWEATGSVPDDFKTEKEENANALQA